MLPNSIRYTKELADEICYRLAEGESLKEICRSPHMPSSTAVRKWVIEDTEGFSSRYARARFIQLEYYEDEIIALGDGVLGTDNNAEVSAAKHAADNRKWLMSKLRPDKYGDRTAITGAGGAPLIPDRASDPERVAHAVLLLLQSVAAKPVLTIEADAGESRSFSDPETER